MSSNLSKRRQWLNPLLFTLNQRSPRAKFARNANQHGGRPLYKAPIPMWSNFNQAAPSTHSRRTAFSSISRRACTSSRSNWEPMKKESGITSNVFCRIGCAAYIPIKTSLIAPPFGLPGRCTDDRDFRCFLIFYCWERAGYLIFEWL